MVVVYHFQTDSVVARGDACEGYGVAVYPKGGVCAVEEYVYAASVWVVGLTVDSRLHKLKVVDGEGYFEVGADDGAWI